MKSKKNIKSIVVMAALGIIALFFINSSFAANTAKVNVETANLRESANANSKLLKQVSINTEIDVLEKLATIYNVDLNYFATKPICANDLIELVERAENIFNNPDITEDKKDKVYTDLMKIYLAMKEGVHHD